MAPLARTGLFHLQDRVEKAPHHFDLGKESPPRLTCRFPAVGADRARLGVWRESLGCLGTRAIAPLHGPRIGRLDHAHPQATAPADGGRDIDLLLRSPGQLLIGHQSRWAPCAGLARWCPAATGGRRPARPDTSTWHRGQRRRPGRQTAPPTAAGRGLFRPPRCAPSWRA